MKRAIWVLSLVSLVGAAVLGSSNPDLLSMRAARVPQLGKEIVKPPPHAILLGAKPGRWVPFRANIKRVFDPESVFVGRFYRASDGSTRSETGPSIAEINIVGIKNMSEGVFYLWLPTSGWESHPMELPHGKYFQPRLDSGVSAEATRVDDQIEGIDLIKGPTDRHGITEYQAPRLNYFALRTTIPCKTAQRTGCGKWYSEVHIDEQPPELFKPPVGVAVLKRSEPGGIVRRSTAFPQKKN